MLYVIMPESVKEIYHTKGDKVWYPVRKDMRKKGDKYNGGVLTEFEGSEHYADISGTIFDCSDKRRLDDSIDVRIHTLELFNERQRVTEKLENDFDSLMERLVENRVMLYLEDEEINYKRLRKSLSL